MNTFIDMARIQDTFISPSICDSMYFNYRNMLDIFIR